ncbi:flagellar biosynthesis anti-sigma factor FlgM [Ruminococcaceae bacterium OttesenSCG-928-A11]|nr:flagellar biosynthesis anti-sigma factor FlgM [Ruminococcaceae bacterium OttesenSCG-928-A11]
MKITSSGLEHYQSVVQSVKQNGDDAPKNKMEKAAGRSDKVTLSEQAAARAGISRLASAMAAEVEGGASAERIEELREAVQSGDYNVSSEDIADAILDVKI